MDFDLSEEQRLLKESVDGLLTDTYDFDSRKKYASEKGGWSRSVWAKLADQGLLGLPFSEDDGGFGAGAVETMIVMEALGKALVLEPYLATVVLGGGFLRRGGSAEQRAVHIPGIIDGSKTFAFAQLEKNSRYDLHDISTSAKKKGDGWVIDGEKFVVLNGETADTLIVTARTKGGQRDSTGIGVFLVALGLLLHIEHERHRPPRRTLDPPQQAFDALLPGLDLPIDRFRLRRVTRHDTNGILRRCLRDEQRGEESNDHADTCLLLTPLDARQVTR